MLTIDFFNFSQTLLCVINKEWQITQINPAWQNLYDKPEQLLNSSFFEWLHPLDSAPTLIYCQQLQHVPTMIQFLTRWRDEKGHYYWLQWQLNAVAQEQIYCAVAQQVSEQQQAWQVLRDKEERFALAIQGSRQGLWDWNLQTNDIYFSPRWKSLLGFNDFELRNHLDTLTEYVHPDDFSMLWAAIEAYLDKRSNFVECIHRMKHKDGGYRWIMTRGAALWNAQEQPYRMVGTAVDITERKQLEEQLAETVTELATILDNSMVGIAYVRGDTVIRANNKLESILAYAHNELCQLSLSNLFPNTSDYNTLMNSAKEAFQRGNSYDCAQFLCTKNKQLLWCRIVSKPLENDASIWLVEDITLQKQAEQNLRLAVTVFEKSASGIAVTDAQTRIQRVNPAFSKITGYSASELHGQRISLLSSGRHSREFFSLMWDNLNRDGHWQGEIWNRRKNGEIYVNWVSISTIQNEQKMPVQYMAVFTDISQLQEDIESARYLASFDSLTGLPNRLLFRDHLQQAIAKARKYGRIFALFFLDLDGFKAVNDTFGHGIGDILLQQVAERLRKAVRETDRVARLAGDEFTMIINDLRTQNEAALVAENVLKQFKQAFIIEKNTLFISVSIGISLYPNDSNDLDTLIKYADNAMYYAKLMLGKAQYCFYSHKDTQGKLALLTPANTSDDIDKKPS